MRLNSFSFFFFGLAWLGGSRLRLLSELQGSWVTLSRITGVTVKQGSPRPLLIHLAVHSDCGALNRSECLSLRHERISVFL